MKGRGGSKTLVVMYFCSSGDEHLSCVCTLVPVLLRMEERFGHRTCGEEMEVLVVEMHPKYRAWRVSREEENQSGHNVICATAETLRSPRATTLENDVVAQGVVSFNNFHP